MVPEISSRTDRQTDTQTDILITMLGNRSRERSNNKTSTGVCAGYLEHGECAGKSLTGNIDELQRCLDAIEIPRSSTTLSVSDLMSFSSTQICR